MHMATNNLCQNLKSVLVGKLIRNIYGWIDSSVALDWIRGKGNYKQVCKQQGEGDTKNLHPMTVYLNRRKCVRGRIKRM